MSAADAAECKVCGSIANLSRCGRCKSVWYCGRAHQKLHWRRGHKLECQVLETSDKSTSDDQRQVTAALVDEKAVAPPEVSNTREDRAQAIPETAAPPSAVVEEGVVAEEPAASEGALVAKAPRERAQPHVHSPKTGAALGEAGDPLPTEGSSERELLDSDAEALGPFSGDTRLVAGGGDLATTPSRQSMALPPGLLRTPQQLIMEQHRMDEIIRCVVNDMDNFGVCLVDNFMGAEQGNAVLREVKNLHNQGLFEEGKLVSNPLQPNVRQKVRGDLTLWTDGREPYLPSIATLIKQVDTVIINACKVAGSTELSKHNIYSRTKAMVACYPGYGSQYVKHVDNPNQDGRCITAIYYLNANWDIMSSGGLLRIFPEGGLGDQVANVVPLFDRLVFFWSDRRNPHEVQPAYDTRYAITLWYYDFEEREAAKKRHLGANSQS